VPRVCHGFVGNSDATTVDQTFGLCGIGCQVQIGEQDLVLAQHGDFGWLRLLHLDDHVSRGKNFGSRINNGRTGSPVIIIFQSDSMTCIRLNGDLVAVVDDFTNRGRGHSNPIFVDFYFFGDTEVHGLGFLIEIWFAMPPTPLPDHPPA